MLELVVPKSEQYDDDSGCFITTKEQTLRLEHSLVSLSKWEAKWHKPYLSTKSKTVEEQIDYVRCMTLTQNVDPNVYTAITPQLLAVVKDYIEDSMTATTLEGTERPPGEGNRDGGDHLLLDDLPPIPFECQKWHLNRLMTLINVCRAKTGPQKKMSQKDIFAQNRALNAARRKRGNTRG